MAKKSVLEEAIKKLEHSNNVLRQTLHTTHGKEAKAISENIARNDSMILDYQFRLKTEGEN